MILEHKTANGFCFVLMGRKGKGNLKRLLSDDDSAVKKTPRSSASVNQGRGQEITGVSLPEIVCVGYKCFGPKLTCDT